MVDVDDATEEIKLAFAALDKDGDSVLSKEEIAHLIRSLSDQSPSAVQIQRLFDVRVFRIFTFHPRRYRLSQSNDI